MSIAGPSPNLVSLGEALASAREERNLSKSAAAEELGVSRMTYGMWERGAWVPELNNVGILSEFTGLSREVVLSELLRMNGAIGNDEYVELR